MYETPYKVGGPLPFGSPVYISRDADEKALLYLRRMEYITIIEPRQQGKTGLIHHLKGQLEPHGYTFAMRDLMSERGATDISAWYASLCKRLLRQMPFITQDQQPQLPSNSNTWEEFLEELAEQARLADQRVVIVLDEIGALPPTWATDFFAVIRSVYTSREIFPAYQHLTFIVAGAFNPNELIQDTAISNFNVDQRISLPDFNIAQTYELVAKLNLPNELTEAMATKIHYWTDGQPYLSQWFCHFLAEQEELITLSNADPITEMAVHHFMNTDIHYLKRVKDLVANPQLLAYVQYITDEQETRNSTGLNDIHFELTHIRGLIKANAQGFCQLRNRICQQALEEIISSYKKKLLPSTNEVIVYSPQNVKSSRPLQVFLSYASEDTIEKDKLLKHLSPLTRQSIIHIWHDSEIRAGSEKNYEIMEKLHLADLILVLISASYIASQHCYDNEMGEALMRHHRGEITVIPIIMKPVVWHDTPFKDIESLPAHGKPITSWTNEDDAFVNIVEGIKKAIERLI